MSKKSQIKDSVVAIFTHKLHVFVIQRQPYLPAFPGYHSFPGGKVERDESKQPYATKFLKDHDPRLMRALCREMQEEINFDLEEAIAKQQVLSFSEFGTAITPTFNPVRFNARFYRVELATLIDFDVDRNEAAWSGWMAAEEFMQQYQQGNLLTAFPTLCAMKALSKEVGVQNIGVMHLTYDPETEVPSVQPIYQIIQMPVKSNTLPPAERTNAFIIGDQQSERYLIDPSPASEEELGRLQNVVATHNITGIFLTHHHPDHHQFSNELARSFQVPMKMSQDSYERITQKFKENYFAQIEIHFAQEGEVLTQWLGKNVLIFEIPGHDEGQLGLAPVTMEWFLVGDLIQGIGTVVISAPEGDMTKYFHTLEKVIALDPKIIIPSHGIPLKSTNRLKETLKHRQARETQILQLHKAGKSKEDILSTIYHDIDPRLFPAAMQNIESHLTKLRLDQQI